MSADTYDELLARQRADFSDAMFSAARRLRWSADRLAAERERRLRALLAVAIERSPFHADRLRGVDVDRFTEADLPSLPIMTKAMMMDDFDRVITDAALNLAVVNEHVDRLDSDDYLLDQFRVIATSGSTGTGTSFPRAIPPTRSSSPICTTSLNR